MYFSQYISRVHLDKCLVNDQFKQIKKACRNFITKLMIGVMLYSSCPVHASNPEFEGGKPIYAPSLNLGEDVQSLFPNDLDDLKFIQHLGGGSGGVAVLEDSQGRKYTLKAAKHSAQIKEEILADALYRAAGVPVPAFMVVSKLPLSILNIIKLHHTNGPFRISQYIEKSRETDSKELLSKLREHRFMDLFLVNYDVKGAQNDNILIDNKGVLWRIDNGGSLRFRACGEAKLDSDHWQLHNMSELDQVKDLNDHEFRIQAFRFLMLFPHMINISRELGAKLRIPFFEELDHDLLSRYNDVQTRFLPHNIPLFSTHYQRATPGKTSASAFLIRYINGTPHTLLGKRDGTGLWGNLGGASDLADNLLPKTAAREIKEESHGVINLSAQSLGFAASHDLLSVDNNSGYTRHRMYFHELDTDVTRQDLLIAKNNSPEHSEYTDYQWFPVEQLLRAVVSYPRVESIESRSSSTKFDTVHINRWNKEDMVLHPPLYRMLMQARVINQLARLCEGKPLKTLATQGWATDELPQTSIFEEPNTSWSSNDVVVVGNKIYSRSRDSLEEGSYRLARTAVLRGAVMAEFKERWFSSHHVQPIQEALLVLPYTQTQAYLMNQYENYNDDLCFIENARRFQADTFKVGIDRDLDFVERIDQILQQEIILKDKFLTVYTGAISEMAAAIDIFTEARKRVEAFSHPDFLLMRGNDEEFVSPDLWEFLKIQSSRRDQSHKAGEFVQLDYSTGYANQALSGSTSLFGSHMIECESAYHYFKTRRSIKPPHFETIVARFFKQFGIKVDTRRYLRLYEDTFEPQSKGDASKRHNTAMFQIFMTPDLMEQMTYNSSTGGGSTSYLVDGDPNPLRSLVQFMQDPKSANKGSVHNNQVKVFLHPSVFMEPSKVRIKRYWRHQPTTLALEAYKRQLSQYITEDLTKALHSKKMNRERTFQSSRALRNGTLSPTEFVYEQAHRALLDHPILYTPSTVTCDELKDILRDNDFAGFYTAYNHLEDTSKANLDQLFNHTLSLIADDSSHFDDKIAACKFLIDQGKQISEVDVTNLVLSIKSDDTWQTENFDEKTALSILTEIMPADMQVSEKALSYAVLKLKSFALTRFLLNRKLDPGIEVGKNSDVDSYFSQFIHADSNEDLDFIRLLCTKLWPNDKVLHNFFNAKNWSALDIFAERNIDKVLKLLINRIKCPTLEIYAKLVRSIRFERALDEDDSVDKSSYTYLVKLLKSGPSDETIDSCLASAIYSHKLAASMILLDYKPDQTPSTDAIVHRLQGTYLFSDFLEYALRIGNTQVNDLFIDRLPSFTTHQFLIALNSGNIDAVKKMASKHKTNLDSALSVSLNLCHKEAVEAILPQIREIACYHFSSAIETGDPNVIKLFEARATDEDYGSMIMKAAYLGMEEFVVRYLDHVESEYLSSAFSFVMMNQECGKELPSNLLSIRDRLFNKLVEIQSKQGTARIESALLSCIYPGDIEYVRKFVETFKPDLNFVNMNMTPVLTAIHYNEPEILDYLLHMGANPNLLRNDGQSPLHFAINTFLRHDPPNHAIYRFFNQLEKEHGSEFIFTRSTDSLMRSYAHSGINSEEGQKAHATLESMKLRMIRILLDHGAQHNPELLIPAPTTEEVFDDEEDDWFDQKNWTVKILTKEESQNRHKNLMDNFSPLKAAQELRFEEIQKLLKSQMKEENQS